MTLHTLRLPLLAAAFSLAGAAATSQSATFNSIDRNGNGVLSCGEIVQAFGRDAANWMWSCGDGPGFFRAEVAGMKRDDDDDDGRSRNDYHD